MLSVVQSDRTCSGQFISGQCPAGGRLMGWPARAQTVYSRPKKRNEHDFFFSLSPFSFALDCESSEHLLFFFFTVKCREGLACDVIAHGCHTRQTNSWSHGLGQNGSAHGRVSTTFMHYSFTYFLLLLFYFKKKKKIICQLLTTVSALTFPPPPSIPIDRNLDASSFGCPFNFCVHCALPCGRKYKVQDVHERGPKRGMVFIRVDIFVSGYTVWL